MFRADPGACAAERWRPWRPWAFSRRAAQGRRQRRRRLRRRRRSRRTSNRLRRPAPTAKPTPSPTAAIVVVTPVPDAPDSKVVDQLSSLDAKWSKTVLTAPAGKLWHVAVNATDPLGMHNFTLTSGPAVEQRLFQSRSFGVGLHTFDLPALPRRDLHVHLHPPPRHDARDRRGLLSAGRNSLGSQRPPGPCSPRSPRPCGPRTQPGPRPSRAGARRSGRAFAPARPPPRRTPPGEIRRSRWASSRPRRRGRVGPACTRTGRPRRCRPTASA